MRAEAEREGIKTHFLSGVRTAEDQRQLFANYQAGLHGQSLPYPERGAVPLAARPGTSKHELGLAADLAADDPTQQAALWALAPKYGLSAIGKGDPNHFQLASNTMASSSGPHGAAVAPDSSQPPVDFRNSVYQTLIGRGLNPQQAMGAMYSLMGESGHGLDPNAYNPNDPGGAMGFAQWVGPRRAGLQAVAKSMGVAETDPSAQLAYFNQELDGKYKGVIDNIKNNASTAADATRIWTQDFEAPKVNDWKHRFAMGAGIGSVGDDGSPKWNTPAIAGGTSAPTPGAPTSVGDALAKLTAEDAKTGKSPLEKLSSALSPKGAQISSPQMIQAQPDESGMLAGPAGQLLAQTMASQAKPLSWSSAPYGSGLAGQQPLMPLGTTLNSSPQPRTLSDYSLNPMYS